MRPYLPLSYTQPTLYPKPAHRALQEVSGTYMEVLEKYLKRCIHWFDSDRDEAIEEELDLICYEMSADELKIARIVANYAVAMQAANERDGR